MFGISELQRRNASPVTHLLRLALKAKLDLDDSAENETANASTKPAWQIVLLTEAVHFRFLGLPRLAARCDVTLVQPGAWSRL